MSDLEKKVQEIVAKDTFGTTCRQCAFFPGGNSGLCLAPWTDGQMEYEDIDPCYEGVYRYITGTPGPHLTKALDRRACTVWLREKGKRGGAKNQGEKWKKEDKPHEQI